MSDDHVYLSLAEGHEDSDARWAFGTGFEDPLHGVDTAVPPGVDAAGLAALCVALGDDALVSAQRLAEWCTRAPELEEEMALANIGLDLLGQARLLYARAGQADGTGRGEDDYAYFRDAAGFRNVRLAELPNGDFAFSMARLLVLSAWRLALFERQTAAGDPVLAAIAAKGVKELTYHRQYAAEWVIRLGDGTEESHRRMRAALGQVAPYVDELLADGPAAVRDECLEPLRRVADAAGLSWPESAGPALPGAGRDGEHTEHLAPLLAELQSVARAHPGDMVTALLDTHRARRVAEGVPDPELPMLTLADLGVLRGVEVTADGTAVASLTPTYSGCPAMAEMRAAVAARLREAGFARVEIRTVLDPPWTSDWITDAGRRKLAEHGIAPPGPAPRSAAGPVPLLLTATRRAVVCPRCGAADTEEISRFSATSCKALWRCRACREPFEHLKEI